MQNEQNDHSQFLAKDPNKQGFAMVSLSVKPETREEINRLLSIGERDERQLYFQAISDSFKRELETDLDNIRAGTEPSEEATPAFVYLRDTMIHNLISQFFNFEIDMMTTSEIVNSPDVDIDFDDMMQVRDNFFLSAPRFDFETSSHTPTDAQNDDNSDYAFV